MVEGRTGDSGELGIFQEHVLLVEVEAPAG